MIVFLGDHNTSAKANQDLLLHSLPPDLKQAVTDDNSMFDQELVQWDEEQRSKVDTSSSKASVSAFSSTSTIQQSAGGTTSSASTMTSSGSQSPQWRGGTSESWLGSPQPVARTRSRSDDQDVVVTGEQRPGEQMT